MAKTVAKGLGKGFEALLPNQFDPSLLLDPSERIQKLLIGHVSPNKNQPRSTFDEQSLHELAESIKRHGILQPLVVTPLADGNYQIVAGERRWRAAKIAGLQSVPALVRTDAELERLEISLIENVQRVDLSPLEQAVSIERLHDQFNLPYKDIASRLGKAETTINNIVRLLGLPDEAKQALREHDITEGHARQILAMREPAKQLELLNLILQNGWSVRQAENYVTAHKSGAKDASVAKAKIAPTNPETERLSQFLKTPVSIKHSAKGGKLEIVFKDEADLNRIITSFLDK